MAQTRTAKGINSDKASGSSLSINDISITEGGTLVVGIAYDNSQGAPTSVKFGNRGLNERRKKTNAGSGFTVAIWTAPYIRHPNIRDLVATWASDIGARAMFATQITES